MKLTRNPRYKAWWGAVLEAAKGAPRLEGEHDMRDVLSGDPQGGALVELARDIFKHGASPKLEARMAVEDLQEAVAPQPCHDCGFQPEIDPSILIRDAKSARDALAKLPPSPFRDKLKQRVFSMLYGQPARVLNNVLEGEDLPSADPQTTAWLSQHLQQQVKWTDDLTVAAAAAVNLIEEGNPDEARDVLREALEWEDIDPKEIDQT